MSMLKWMAAGLAILGSGLLMAMDDVQATSDPNLMTIGTGGVTGVYYPAGGAICRLINRERKDHGLRCSVESTDGSTYNIQGLRSGKLDFAVVQSDIQHHAWQGTREFAETGPYAELRAVFSMHAEAFTLVARAGTQTTDVAQLQGLRINAGHPGSGQRIPLEQWLDLQGQDLSLFSLVTDLRAPEMASALCTNRIDLMVYIVGHPSSAIQEVTRHCDSRLISLGAGQVDRLVQRYPYYRSILLPGGLYAGNPADVLTFGVAATLVTSAQTSEEQVYRLVRAVFENFEVFARLHPAFTGLDRQAMIQAGLTAPLHPGALRYYQEAGLLPDS